MSVGINLSKRTKDFIDAADDNGNIRNNPAILQYLGGLDSALIKAGITDGAVYPWVGNSLLSYKYNLLNPSEYILDYDYLANQPTAVEQGISFNNNSLATVTNDAREILQNGSGTLGYYSVNNTSSNSTVICADNVGTGNNTAALYIRFGDFVGIDLYRASDGGRAGSTNNNISKGFTLGTRTSINDLRLYKDSLLKATNTLTQAGDANVLSTPLVIGGNIYTYRTDSIGGFAIISPQGLSDIEAKVFSHDITTLQRSLGRG